MPIKPTNIGVQFIEYFENKNNNKDTQVKYHPNFKYKFDEDSTSNSCSLAYILDNRNIICDDEINKKIEKTQKNKNSQSNIHVGILKDVRLNKQQAELTCKHDHKKNHSKNKNKKKNLNSNANINLKKLKSSEKILKSFDDLEEKEYFNPHQSLTNHKFFDNNNKIKYANFFRSPRHFVEKVKERVKKINFL